MPGLTPSPSRPAFHHSPSVDPSHPPALNPSLLTSLGLCSQRSLSLQCRVLAPAFLETQPIFRHSGVIEPYPQVQVTFKTCISQCGMGVCHEAELTWAWVLPGSTVGRQLWASHSLTFMFTDLSTPSHTSRWKFSDVSALFTLWIPVMFRVQGCLKCSLNLSEGIIFL